MKTSVFIHWENIFAEMDENRGETEGNQFLLLQVGLLGEGGPEGGRGVGEARAHTGLTGHVPGQGLPGDALSFSVYVRQPQLNPTAKGCPALSPWLPVRIPGLGSVTLAPLALRSTASP